MIGPPREVVLLRDRVACAHCREIDHPFFAGTFAPFLRACDSPMAMACLRLFTVFPDRPLFSLPRLYSCMAFSTFSLAFGPYFRAMIAFSNPRPGDTAHQKGLHATCQWCEPSGNQRPKGTSAMRKATTSG